MSILKPLSKFEKEKQKLVQEKCQALLNDMLRDEDNKYCVDCDAKGPRWASWNLGIFLCIRCAGIHRNLGVHISRVKSVNLDLWSPDQVVHMQQMGNSRGRAVYEANLPDTNRRPQNDAGLESFIRAKYEQKKYIAHEWVKPKIPEVNWDSEIEESLKKKKDKKVGAHSDIGPLPTPIPKPKPNSNSSPSSKTKMTSSNDSSTVNTTELTNDLLNSSSSSSSAKNSNSSSFLSNDLLGLNSGEITGGGVGAFDFVDTNISLSQQQGNNLNSNTGLPYDPFVTPIKTSNQSSQQNQINNSGDNINSLTTLTTNEDDLGSIFTANSEGLDDFGNKKMTNSAILSLYAQNSNSNMGGGGGGIIPGGGGGGVPGGGLNLNPFMASPGMFAGMNAGGGGGGGGNNYPQTVVGAPIQQFNPNPMMQQGVPSQFGNYGNLQQTGLNNNNMFNNNNNNNIGDLNMVQQQMQGLNLSFTNSTTTNSFTSTGINNQFIHNKN